MNEINNLIAEHVMGWEPALEADDPYYNPLASDEDTAIHMVWNGSQGFYTDIGMPDVCVDCDDFDPMEDMNEAMKVFDKVGMGALRHNTREKTYCAFYPNPDGIMEAGTIEDTPAKAICLAALEANNIEVPQ